MRSEDLALKLASYDQIWRKFVDAHNCFMELMELEPEKRKALMVYDEELARKLETDGTVKRLRDLSLDLFEVIGGSQRSARSRGIDPGRRSAEHVSTVSKKSKSSYVSAGSEARREKMALARLNLEHLKRKQELDRKMAEINYAKELMEAEGRQREPL